MKQKFFGRVEQNKLHFYNVDMVKKHNISLEGFEVEVTIAKVQKDRSLQQNKWLWGVCYKLISEWTGMTPEEVHWCEPITNLRIDRTGKFPVIKSTAKMSTAEFKKYMEDIQMWGAENECNIPDPNEVEL